MLDWMVIGAGPAGIAAVGKLLDQGIPAQQIGWMDPHFTVGDLGRKWGEVPSNTQVLLFNRYLENCKAFQYGSQSKKFPLESLDPQDTCQLKKVAEPLQMGHRTPQTKSADIPRCRDGIAARGQMLGGQNKGKIGSCEECDFGDRVRSQKSLLS